MRTWSFTVLGRAQSAGSKRAIVNRHTGRAHLVDQSGDAGKNWRTDCRAEAAVHHTEPLSGPVSVMLTFFRARPKGHYGTGRNAEVLKPGSPTWVTMTPDIDKMVRAALDAFTGIVYVDDRQVVELAAFKRYTDGPERMEVVVADLADVGPAREADFVYEGQTTIDDMLEEAS